METIHKTVQTDKGGELWGSHVFQKAIAESKFLLEPTAPDTPSQNGLAERPNQTLATMVRCLLHSANLGHEYWSFALLHATYLKNRLPHSSINTTPYHKYTNKRPSAKLLRIFGCPIIVRNPGRHPTKLDMHTSSGIFLGYTATDKNVYCIDCHTGRIKTGTHCIFDEAAMTLPPAMNPPAAKALQQLGYSNHTATGKIVQQSMDTSQQEIPPVRIYYIYYQLGAMQQMDNAQRMANAPPYATARLPIPLTPCLLTATYM
jgi:hypothetical protein